MIRLGDSHRHCIRQDLFRVPVEYFGQQCNLSEGRRDPLAQRATGPRRARAVPRPEVRGDGEDPGC